MYKLSPLVQKAFDQWIKADTWYKAHPNDEERFYRFVWAAVRVSRNGGPSEQDIRDLIHQEWDGKMDPGYLDDEALRASSLYRSLYDFGKARNARVRFILDADHNPLL